MMRSLLNSTNIKNHVRRTQVTPTKPTKKRTAVVLDLTALYCIQVLLTAIRRLKLLAVEKTPMTRSNGVCADRGLAFNNSRSTTCSESSDVGRPLARIDSSFRSPEILISLTSHGSKV